MNIVPSSTIHLLKNVPLDPDYQHTIRFTSRSDQITYFGDADLHVKSFTNQTYQRYEKGRLRIRALADELYECNYMCFQNTGHMQNAKWFYAFVKSVDYINENCTEITYQIDYLQTYLFDIEIQQCFIEREHTSTDEFDDWLVPEDLETGEYKKSIINHIDFGTMKIYAVNRYYFDEGGNPQQYDGGWLPTQGTFSSLYFDKFSCSNTGDDNAEILGTYISHSVEYNDNLIDVMLAPDICTFGKEYDAVNDDIINQLSSVHAVKEVVIDKPSTIDGYTPVNKKVLTNPYVSLLLDDNMGTQKEYSFEMFYNETSTCLFKMYGNALPFPVINTTPFYYKGSKINWSETIETSGFPTCATNIDTYKQWLAENKSSIAVKEAISVGTIVGGAILGNAPMAIGGLTGLAGIMAQKSDKKVNAIKGKTSANGSTLQMALKHMGITAYKVSITKTMAKTIDNFFSMYGYAVHKLKKPNVFGGGTLRPHWNYIKTRNCQLSISNCPADVNQTICEVFNNGITFWEKGSEVGNYALNNKPVP